MVRRHLSPRRVLLASLEKRNRVWLGLVWSLVVVVILLAGLWPLLWPAPSADATDFGRLDAEQIRSVRRITDVERRKMASLPVMSRPLTPSAPPPQAVGAAAPGELFGVRSEEAAGFNEMTAGLRASTVDCGRWIGSAAADGSPRGVTVAQERLDEMRDSAGRDRGVFHYHQGLILLCGPNAASAEDSFRQALTAYQTYTPPQGAAGASDRRKLAQYRTVTHYGLALALLAGGADPGAVDRELLAALDAAKTTKVHRQPGPFVTLRACTTGPNCDLFEYSTAEVFNARLYNWLRAGRPADAYRKVGKELLSSPGYASGQPALAANLAAAAAAVGDGAGREALFRETRARLMQTPVDGTALAATPEWARLAAFSVLTPGQVYAEGDPWPTGADASNTRLTFNERGFGPDPGWFPPISYLDGEDANDIDLWLWIRRERNLLETANFNEFRRDGEPIRNLGVRNRTFLEQWRRQISAQVGESLLRKAELKRVKEGQASARPLLEVLAGPGFPVLVQTQAKLSLGWGSAPATVLGWTAAGVLLALLLTFLHFQLAIGYSRAFSNRHHVDRMRRQAREARTAL
jgi:hypothetical protein